MIIKQTGCTGKSSHLPEEQISRFEPKYGRRGLQFLPSQTSPLPLSPSRPFALSSARSYLLSSPPQSYPISLYQRPSSRGFNKRNTSIDALSYVDPRIRLLKCSFFYIFREKEKKVMKRKVRNETQGRVWRLLLSFFPTYLSHV